MNNKDIERLEIVKDALTNFIVAVTGGNYKTTPTVEVQALAEVVMAFCKVVELSRRIISFD